MTNKRQFLLHIRLIVGLFLCPSPPLTHATVFAWKGEGGALHLSNDPEEVPEAHRNSAQQFTSKLAGKAAPENPASVSPPPPSAEPTSGYERGIERGLVAAERQMAMTNELLNTVLQAVPQPPPLPTIIIQQQPETLVRYVDHGPSYFPYYGFISPYSSSWGVPYAYHYPYGFSQGRFVPHSHFFPGTRGRNAGIFFPHGHSSHHGFLFGHGLIVR